MITLCTVVLNSCERYTHNLLESIIRQTKLISEVLIAHPDMENINESYKERGIEFHKFSHKEEMYHSHALCLHECISRAKNEFVLLCDPDVFFYSAAEELYLELFNRYDLGVVGVSHHNSINQAQGFFPYAFNMFLKKSILPDENWMVDLIKTPAQIKVTPLKVENQKIMNGKWLLPGVLDDHYKRFPNYGEDAIFDVGCNLHLWAQDQNWKWLSFQTTDCHSYTTKYYRSNFKLKEKFKFQKLIYHSVGSTNARDCEFKEYQDNYESSKKVAIT